jgi:hypothetical protein
MTTMSRDQVVPALLARVPELANVYEEHLRTFEGEALESVLFGDLTRFVIEAYQRGDRDLVDRCLEFLELALATGDEYVENLVAVSFVENVGPWDPEQRRFIRSWPRRLRKEARRQRDWRPPGQRGLRKLKRRSGE